MQAFVRKPELAEKEIRPVVRDLAETIETLLQRQRFGVDQTPVGSREPAGCPPIGHDVG
ncbi:MAG TPA: hypothetical protein VIW26_08805 [Gemmatimonadales bacterium]|jgi:hypothetical protein